MSHELMKVKRIRGNLGTKLKGVVMTVEQAMTIFETLAYLDSQIKRLEDEPIHPSSHKSHR